MLRAAHSEIWLYIYPVPSKCDPDGSKFCTKAIPFKMEPGDETVQLFIAEELRMHEQGLDDDQRAREPLFTAEPGVAFHRSAIDDALRDALLLFVASSIAAHISWHSYRVRLACKLKAARCDNPTIQALVRWNTDQAIAVYARYEREEYWHLLQQAASQDATSVQFTALPESNPDALPEIDEMQRVIHRLNLAHASWSDVEATVNNMATSAHRPAERVQQPSLSRPSSSSPMRGGPSASAQPARPRAVASSGALTSAATTGAKPRGWTVAEFAHLVDFASSFGNRHVQWKRWTGLRSSKAAKHAWARYRPPPTGAAAVDSSVVPPAPAAASAEIRHPSSASPNALPAAASHAEAVPPAQTNCATQPSTSVEQPAGAHGEASSSVPPPRPEAPTSGPLAPLAPAPRPPAPRPLQPRASSRQSRGAPPARLGLGDGWAGGAASSWISTEAQMQLQHAPPPAANSFSLPSLYRIINQPEPPAPTPRSPQYLHEIVVESARPSSRLPPRKRSR